MFAGRVLISDRDTLRKGFFFRFDRTCPETLVVPRAPYGLWEIHVAGVRKRIWSRSLQVYPADGRADRGIVYRGNAYPGKFRLVPASTGGLQVINEVPVEVYLPGVVQAEMGPQFPPAALQAQAVAARTYVLRRLMEDGPYRAYHLYGDTRHQAYRGASVVEKVRQAVWATRGLALFEADGQTPAYTFYSANCGGMLASGAEVFGVEAPYLRPHRDGSGDTLFCEYATRYVPALRWFRKREFWRAFLPWSWLNRTYRDIAPIRKVRILSFSPSGRVRALQIVGARGVRVVEGQARVRRWMAKRLLPSTLFRIRTTREGVWLEGWGHGHGVGMCQVGAGGMAALGHTARQILSHYYPGTRLRRLW
jgi:stage II sporulation protein D